MAGAGIKARQTVGETIPHLVGRDHTKLTFRYQGRQIHLTDVASEVVQKLLT